jgi:hypothetical protein
MRFKTGEVCLIRLMMWKVLSRRNTITQPANSSFETALLFLELSIDREFVQRGLKRWKKSGLVFSTDPDLSARGMLIDEMECIMQAWFPLSEYGAVITSNGLNPIDPSVFGIFA